ncbi:MAG TPA: hypothetical protein VKP30_00770 [Polyangiaceae bacterium]|nr:hypothetical protein [Polyangiaceae bacterium]
MSTRSFLCLYVACLQTCACAKTDGGAASKPKPTYEVVVTARRGDGDALAGVEVLRETRTLGTTDAGGALRLALSGNEGETVALTVKCPLGFESPTEPLLVGLRRLGIDSSPPSFDAECKPLTHTLIVGVRADHGAGLAVVRLGKTVARMDALGVAHFAIEAKPSEQVVVKLDTSSNANLRPENPTFTFVAPDREELVLFEQKFTVKRTVVRATKKAMPTRL